MGRVETDRFGFGFGFGLGLVSWRAGARPCAAHCTCSTRAPHMPSSRVTAGVRRKASTPLLKMGRPPSAAKGAAVCCGGAVVAQRCEGCGGVVRGCGGALRACSAE